VKGKSLLSYLAVLFNLSGKLVA